MTAPRLLLVDDDPDLAAVLRILCRRAGYGLTHAGDARVAWVALESGPFDLVLLDVNLPGASGVDLLRRLRAEPRLATPPVALFCQPGLAEDVAAGWAAGADYLVSKDLAASPDTWRRRIDEVVNDSRGRPSARPVWITGSAGREESNRLDRARGLAPFRGMAPALLEVVARRAWREAFGGEDSPGLGEWLRGQPIPPQESAPPEQLRRCLDSLVDQVGRLFGHDACEQFASAIHPDRHGSPERVPPPR